MTSVLAFVVLCLLLVLTVMRRGTCKSRAWSGFASAYTFLSYLIVFCIGLELVALTQ